MVMNGRSVLLPSGLPFALFLFCTLSSVVDCLGVMGSGFRMTSRSFPLALRPLWDGDCRTGSILRTTVSPIATLIGTSPKGRLPEQRFALSVGLEVVLQN